MKLILIGVLKSHNFGHGGGGAVCVLPISTNICTLCLSGLRQNWSRTRRLLRKPKSYVYEFTRILLLNNYQKQRKVNKY